MTVVLGVDACPGGWVGVELDAGAFAAAHWGSTLEDVVRRVPAAAIIAVDIPLGLVDAGWREADRAAKAYLGRRSSSVYMTPPRAALAEDTHALATARCRGLTGNGFSVQAWGLKAKLLEANSLYESGRYPLREVHPEASFTAMGLLTEDGSKKSWRGQRARLRVLHENGIDLPDELGLAGGVPTDDVLDAGAGAWSAGRIAAGEGTPLPDPPQLNERGQQVAIWF
jgi:predicted RNase H-like nuclease